jgi:purine nucleosidase
MSDVSERVWDADRIAHRSRVVCDNDYCGDPDGAVQIAHHLLCKSIDIRAVVSSAVAPHHPSWNHHCADDGAAIVRRIAELAGRPDVPILCGSSEPITSNVPTVSPGAEALVAEAMRDADLPLFVACAGGLTTVASAWLMEPRIADRLTVVWLGGHAYDVTEDQLPADYRYRETNVMTDMAASQIVFNDSDLSLWQIPQDAFSDLVASRSELLVRMRPHGPLGAYLFDSIGARVDAWSSGIKMGETYAFGDESVVLLTALGGAYSPEPISCGWITRPRPRLLANGLYEDNPDGAPIRVFTKLDTRLLFEDLYAKLEARAAGLD